MTDTALLRPISDKQPAKVKDPGVIALVMAGEAAYNAKTEELLFLPGGYESCSQQALRLRQALFSEAGLQPVDCGSDEAVFSLAERYLRDWGEAARSFCDTRGRTLNLIGWSDESRSAMALIRTVMETVTTELNADAPCLFSFVEETQPGDERVFFLVSKSEPGTLSSREGLLCPACGRILLEDSPTPVGETQEQESAEELREVHTPGANTIIGLCEQLNLPVARTIKAMLYVAGPERVPVAAFVRGDRNISMNKLASLLRRTKGLDPVRTALGPELQERFGEVAGYCGPIGLPEHVTVICDESVRGTSGMVVGANKPGYHLLGAQFGRDYSAEVADIAAGVAGMPCPCGQASFEACTLRSSGAIGYGVNQAATPFVGETSYKALSCRTREGAQNYPVQWNGNISVQSIVLAAAARRAGG